MRLLLILSLCAFLSGCPLVMQGILKNESDGDIYQAPKAPRDGPIRIGEEGDVRLLFPGACIELEIAGTPHYYKVPNPPQAARVSWHWNSTYKVVLNSKGLFYVGDNIEPVKFEELPRCPT